MMREMEIGKEANKWQLNRAGLVNYWYYDDEEFHFADGRLLLRGSNGSGKSVTMQSLITVLLDGVKSPDRLDSFGSRSRRMEDYLLGEKELVNRDERVGYLYLEYKRQHTGQYLTTGIGLQARRGGSMDFWGFVVTDNRRVKHGLDLLKSEINPADGSVQRIPLTRLELERALGTGGQVVRSQKEYMELVNRYVFGFATSEQYEELMKLLIQLRSPKLSKDFKPSVIYEILNESLPSLSDEELRPLSDTIESMERTKRQLEQLERDRQALGRLCRQYDLYNTYMLAEKAESAQRAQRRLNKLQRDRTELSERIEAERRLLTLKQQLQAELEQELTVLQAARQELEQHDVFRAEQQKLERERQLAEVSAQYQQKQSLLADKQSRERQELARALDYEKQAEECLKRMDEMLPDMADWADEGAFAQHTLYAAAFRQNQPEFSFAAWRNASGSHSGKLNEVLACLRRQSEARLRHEQIDRRLGEERRLLDEYRAEHRRLEQQFADCRDKLLAEIYSWHKQYGETLPLEQDELRQMAQAVQGLYEGSAWNEVQAPLELAYGRRLKALNQELGLLNAQIRNGEEQEREVTAELTTWRNRRDPEPDRLPDVQATRNILAERGISFVPLYAAIEFKGHVTTELRERIEAALTEMGLLDGLIIPERCLKDIPGDDVYGAVIRPNPQFMAITLADYLYPTPIAESGVTEADINDVLSSILVEDMAVEQGATGAAGGQTVLSVNNGVYRHGLVSGRAARRRTAVYIGRQARQEFRRQQIAGLEQRLAQLALELERLHGCAAGSKKQLEQAGQAKGSFPGEADISKVYHEKQAVTANIARQEQRVQLDDQLLRQVVAELQALRSELQAVSAGISLPPSEAGYIAAGQAMQRYQEAIYDLELVWNNYSNFNNSDRQSRERLAEIQLDVDALKGESLVFEGQIDTLKLEITHIEARLQQLGADELRERIRQVAQRLADIPQEKEAVVTALATIRAGLASGEQQLARLAHIIAFFASLSKCWQQVVQAELRLGLVYGSDGEPPALSVILQEQGSVLRQERLDRVSVTDRLSKSYHAENGILVEYRMQLEPMQAEPADLPTLPEPGEEDGELQSELERLQEKAQRQIVTLDYEGRRHSPGQMQFALDEQITVQKAILSDKDKELYEEVIMNSIGRIISRRIRSAQQWVEEMNKLMQQRDTSSGLRFKLDWKAKLAEQDEELDTADLVKLLHADPVLLKEEDLSRIVQHFQLRIERAKRVSEGAAAGSAATFQQAVRDVLDYRQWFQFRLYYEQAGLSWRELTDRVFFKFSGGEKAMAMYIPLFSAVYSRYQEARADAPYVITLDEAFAGVDENNIRDMFALVDQLGFNYIMNSQALWGDYDVIPALSIYELVRPKNAPYVTVVSYYWNGRIRSLNVNVQDEPELSEVAATHTKSVS